MPKMAHPDYARPLSVPDGEVEARTALGWALVEGQAPAPKPAAKTATKKAVTRKSVK